MTQPPYTIRPATEADAETIKQMVRSAPLNPNAIDWHYFRVLEIQENGAPKIVSIGMVYQEGSVHELDSVTTRPAYRKRGYAEAVVRDWLIHAPRPLFLLAEADLIAYYEKLGFKQYTMEDAPAEMREQAEYINARWGTYYIMGMVE